MQNTDGKLQNDSSKYRILNTTENYELFWFFP